MIHELFLLNMPPTIDVRHTPEIKNELEPKLLQVETNLGFEKGETKDKLTESNSMTGLSLSSQSDATFINQGQDDQMVSNLFQKLNKTINLFENQCVCVCVFLITFY